MHHQIVAPFFCCGQLTVGIIDVHVTETTLGISFLPTEHAWNKLEVNLGCPLSSIFVHCQKVRDDFSWMKLTSAQDASSAE